MGRFPHHGEDFVIHMLRGHFQLSADMVFYKIPKKFIGRIQHQIIKTDSGPYKNFFNLRHLSQLAKQ